MKNIVVIALFIFSFANLHGQENRNDFRDRTQLGFKLGTNLSNVYDAEGQDFVADSKFGLAAGLYLRLPLSKFLGLQPEFLFSQKGFTATGSLLGSNYSMKRTTNFVDVPVMIAFKPTGFLTIVAGPQFSYLLKQKDVFTNGAVTVLQEQEFKNESIRKNILCFTGGVDVNIKHLVLSARAGWDLQRNNGDGTSATPRYKNAWYQFTVGYRLYYYDKN